MTCKHTLLCKIHLHLKVKKQWNDVMCYLTFHEFSMCQRFEWSPKTSSINILICSIIWFTHLWLGIVLPAQYVIFGMNMILTESLSGGRRNIVRECKIDDQNEMRLFEFSWLFLCSHSEVIHVTDLTIKKNIKKEQWLRNIYNNTISCPPKLSCRQFTLP